MDTGAGLAPSTVPEAPTKALLLDILSKNLEQSLAIKANLERIITEPNHSSTFKATLTQPEIWETVIRTHTTNIITHKHILESLDKHGLEARPDAWQEVKIMLKDALELIFCARRLHEYVMSAQAKQERGSLVGEEVLQQPSPTEEDLQRIPEQPRCKVPPSGTSNTPTSTVADNNAPTNLFYVDTTPNPLPIPQIPIPSGPRAMTKKAKEVPTTNGHIYVPPYPTNPPQPISAHPSQPADPIGVRQLKAEQLLEVDTSVLSRGKLQKMWFQLQRVEAACERAELNLTEAQMVKLKKQKKRLVDCGVLNHVPGPQRKNGSVRKSDVSMKDADVEGEDGGAADAGEGEGDVSMMSNMSTGRKKSQAVYLENGEIPPQAEYEDISAEVDAQLQAREWRKQKEELKEMGMLSTEKRKRQSGASEKDFDIAIRDGNVSRRETKRLKAEKAKSTGDTTTGADNTPSRKNKEDVVGEKRVAPEVDPFEGLDKRAKKKLKKEMAAQSENGWGV